MPRRSASLTALAALVALNLVGILGFMTITGVDFTDALYMTVITLSTVRFHEVRPLETGATVHHRPHRHGLGETGNEKVIHYPLPTVTHYRYPLPVTHHDLITDQ